MGKHRKFTKEFKAETVALVEQQGLSINQVAKDMSLSWTQVDQWVKQAKADRSDNTDMLTTAEKEELRALRRENRKFRLTTDSKHNKPVAPNLLDRKIDAVKQPNAVWASDITYIKTMQGWLYLAVIIDVFSRRVVGYRIDTHMRAELVTEALLSALKTRDVSIGLMHHSDRGSQYAGDDFQAIAHSYGIILSMSRKANCWDNALAESFFATLKKDLIYRQNWFSRKQVSVAIDEYISWYNRDRRHSSLGYLAPADYERLTMLADVA